MRYSDCLRGSPLQVVPALFLCFSGLIASPFALANKTDIVYLKNGDRVTGEIKNLVRGEMRLKTDTFGIIYVKWQDVERIKTDKRLQVELVSGQRYFGPALADNSPGKLSVQVESDVETFDIDRIVFIQPIKGDNQRVGNLINSLAVGFTFTKASDVMQWHINASTEYRTQKYLVSASYDSLITNNGSGTDSTRRNLGGSYYRFRKNRWLWFGNANIQENDQLGVDGRVLTGAGVGRFVSQSQSHEFILAGGLSANFEKSVVKDGSGDDTETSLEGLLLLEWTYFKLQTPKSQIDISFDFYPGLTDTGRQRGDLRVRYRQEFLADLFWNLTYFDNFDTKPPLGATSKRDYGLITSLEYKF